LLRQGPSSGKTQTKSGKASLCRLCRFFIVGAQPTTILNNRNPGKLRSQTLLTKFNDCQRNLTLQPPATSPSAMAPEWERRKEKSP